MTSLRNIRGAAIKTFEPAGDIDVERLAECISLTPKISVDKGLVVRDDTRGIKKDRDVREFRFYDQEYFALLDAFTRFGAVQPWWCRPEPIRFRPEWSAERPGSSMQRSTARFNPARLRRDRMMPNEPLCRVDDLVVTLGAVVARGVFFSAGMDRPSILLCSGGQERAAAAVTWSQSPGFEKNYGELAGRSRFQALFAWPDGAPSRDDLALHFLDGQRSLRFPLAGVSDQFENKTHATFLSLLATQVRC